MENPAPDIGSVLRQARMRRGQSLEVVQQQTRIPRKMLEALEANRFEEFPAIVYLRGFLKNYCDHLDLDFDPLWSQVDPAKPKAQPDAGATPKDEPAPKHRTEHEPEGELAASGPSAAQLLPVMLVGGLAVAAASVWLLKSAKPAAPPEVVAPPAQPPSEIAPINAPTKMSLRVVAKQDAWMQLSTDGVLRFQGRAPAGLALSWEAMDAFLLRTKDPGSLSIVLDGKEFPLADSQKTSAGDYKIVRP